jgi:hypothetical protein
VSLNGSAAPVQVSASRRIGVAWSRSLAGPWSRADAPILSAGPRGEWDGSDVSNAAPCVLRNGAVLLGYRAGGDSEKLGGGIRRRRWSRSCTAMYILPERSFIVLSLVDARV